MPVFDSALRTALKDAAEDIQPAIGLAEDAWRRGRRRRTLSLASISAAVVVVCALAIGSAALLSGGQHDALPADHPSPSASATHVTMPSWLGPDCMSVWRPDEPTKSEPFAKICVPTVATGFPTATVGFGIWGPGSGPITMAGFIVGNKIQPHGGEQIFPDADGWLDDPNGPQALVQVWKGGSFAKQGNPQLGTDVTSHTTALGEPAAVIQRADGSSKVLVSAHGYDILASGTGNEHGWTPVSVDQLVHIIDSIRNL